MQAISAMVFITKLFINQTYSVNKIQPNIINLHKLI